jgi:hypothetical protein
MRFLFAVVLALGIAAAAYGAAASLTVTSGALQAGSDTTLTCTASVSVSFENTDSNILNGWEQATITPNQAGDCQSEEVLVEVLDGTTVVASGSGTMGSGLSTSITLSDPLTPGEVAGATEVRVIIVS